MTKEVKELSAESCTGEVAIVVKCASEFKSKFHGFLAANKMKNHVR